jgi:transcription-repair coupling factor (superfamily II helicase)
MRGEFLDIEYAKGDKLYVPVAQLHLVSRYSGPSPELAPLHSLGGEQWEKAKKKAAEKVRDVAAELLEIQAKRQRAPASRWTSTARCTSPSPAPSRSRKPPTSMPPSKR